MSQQPDAFGAASASSDGAVRRLRRRLYTVAFVDEFAPLYALLTLWFNDNAVSTAQISIAFIMWAVFAVVLEVPSGALADRIDRRKLIASAFVIRAGGITVWLIWPTFAGLLIGAVLWAVHDAFASGTWEAMIHDQLEMVHRETTYGVVIARVGQFTNVGLAAGTLVASGLVGIGIAIESIGWFNVAGHAVSIALVLSLTDASRQPQTDRGNGPEPDLRSGSTKPVHPLGWHDPGEEPTSFARWAFTLRSGLAAARHQPPLLRLIVVGAAIGGLFVIDEYIPLLARERGASDAAVPLILLVVWLGLIVGGEFAARRPDVSSSTLATAMLGGTAVMAFAVAIDSPIALVAIGVGYAVLEAVWVVADARFQAVAPAATRATVTSVRGLGEGLVAGIAFVLIAALTDGDDPSPGLHWVIGLLALVSLLVWRWVPNRSASTRIETR